MASGYDSQPSSGEHTLKPFFVFSAGIRTKEKSTGKGVEIIEDATILSWKVFKERWASDWSIKVDTMRVGREEKNGNGFLDAGQVHTYIHRNLYTLTCSYTCGTNRANCPSTGWWYDYNPPYLRAAAHLSVLLRNGGRNIKGFYTHQELHHSLIFNTHY